MGGGKGDIITSLPGIRREAFFGLLGRRYDDDSHDCPALDGSVDSEVGGKNRMGNSRDLLRPLSRDSDNQGTTGTFIFF